MDIGSAKTRSLSRSVAVGLLAMAFCSDGGPVLAQTAKPFATLDGQAPLVIGHRGLPGLVPEETLPSYDMAAALGTDAFEEDLHLTKDCVLVARHNPWLSDNTNVAEVAKGNPEVAARKRTVPGVRVKVAWAAARGSGPADYLVDPTNPNDPKSVLKSLIVDGEDHTNDWSITDFTLAELKAWLGGTTYDAASERPAEFNGKFTILSFQEIIDLAKRQSKATGRPIAVYPEAKNPTWNDAQAIANGCDAPGSHPLEDAFIDISRKTASIRRTRRSMCRASSRAA